MKLTAEHLRRILEGDLEADEHWRWHIEVVREKARIFIDEACHKRGDQWNAQLIDELIAPDSPIFYINPRTLPENVPQRFRDSFRFIADILRKFAGSQELHLDCYRALNEHLAKLADGHQLHSLACRTIVTLQPGVFAMIMLDDLYGSDGMFALLERHVTDPHLPRALTPIDRHRNWYEDNHHLLEWLREIITGHDYVTAYATHLVYVLRLFDKENEKFMDKYARYIRAEKQ